ncbi:FAD/NAD(P)-binding protein, partial [Corynebacterium sp.]|uniref:FAD/NAD(P)-binding protein n=1 Tax=Corynebacterium sp. TaxID=1720 RepID=UPI0026E03A68
MTTVAIIGGGPRGLWAAEELLGLAREHGAAIDLHIFDGGGLHAYDTDQPGEWLINVRSSAIHTGLGSFNTWRGADDPFPPRREVGAFLAASWDALRRHIPPRCALTWHDIHVESIERRGEQWSIGGLLADEVLLATGHAATWPGSLEHADLPVPVVMPYPASNLQAIGPQDRVLVRGAALTFIDIIRACDPAVFIPVTRTGRLMETKPELDGIAAADIIDAGNTLLIDAPDADALTAALATTARRLLERAGRSGDVDAVLAGTDRDDPDAAWAVGLTWRECYAGIVERASYAGRDSLDGFGELCRRLERVAFGPPPESVTHLADLVASGKVDLSHLGRGGEDLTNLIRELDITV